MATPEERIKALREEINLKLESNELDKASRAITEESLRNLDKKNASEAEYQALLKKTKIELDAVSRSADYVAQSFFDAVNDLTKSNKLIQEQRQNLKTAEADKVMRDAHIKGIEEYLDRTDTTFEEFDDDFFRRIIEKVKVQSMVEVVFIFKTGVEIREVLG